jgi:hypothetical protein
MTMSDLTDEDIARCEQTSDFCSEDFWSLLAEVKRHRSALAADEERVRSVVSEIGRAMIAAQVNAGAWLDSLYLQGPAFVDAIATRAAKQLATAAGKLSEEERRALKRMRVREETTASAIGFLDAGILADTQTAIALIDRLLATGAKP